MSDIKPLGETSYPCLAISHKYDLTYATVLLYVDFLLGRADPHTLLAASHVVHLLDVGQYAALRMDVGRYVLAPMRMDVGRYVLAPLGRS